MGPLVRLIPVATRGRQARAGAVVHGSGQGRGFRVAGVAADVTAIVLTVACAAVAACCALLVLLLWRAGRNLAKRP